MEYEFTSDWFSRNVPVWTEMLARFMGKDAQPCDVLEIGSYEGRSSFWLADNLPRSRVDCVDVWEYNGYGEGAEQRFDRNHLRCERCDRVHKYKGLSRDVLPTFWPNRYDFAYIDGWHEARSVLTDFVIVLPLLRPGALVCFDDYQWTGDQVYLSPKPAIDAVMKLWGDVVEVLHVGWQVWVRCPTKKIPASQLDI